MSRDFFSGLGKPEIVTPGAAAPPSAGAGGGRAGGRSGGGGTGGAASSQLTFIPLWTSLGQHRGSSCWGEGALLTFCSYLTSAGR